mgnify:FL=1
MAGYTISVTGNSNDSNLVLASESGSILDNASATDLTPLTTRVNTLETTTLKGVFTMDSEFTNYQADYKLQFNFDIIDLPVNTTSGNIKLLSGTVGPTNDYFEYFTYLAPTGTLETGGGKEINIPNRNLPLFKVTPEIRAQLDGVTLGFIEDNSVLGQWMEANGYSTTLSAEESYKQTYDYTNMPLWNGTFGYQLTDPSLPTYLSPKMTLDRTKVVILLDVSKNDLILYTGFFQNHTDFSGTPNPNGNAQNYWEPHNAWVFYERIIKKQEYSTLFNSISQVKNRTTTLETSMNSVESRVTNLESKYPSGTYYFNTPFGFPVNWTFSISGGDHVTELDVGSQNIHSGPIKYSITNEGLINTNFSDYYFDIDWRKMAISRFVYNKSNNTVNYNDLDNNIYQGDETDYKIITESPNATLIKYMNYDLSNGVYSIRSLGLQGDNYASNNWPNAMFQERKFLVLGAVNVNIPSFNLLRKVRQLLVLDNSNGEYVVSHIHGNGPNDLYNEVGTGPSGERYTITEGPSTHHHSDKTNIITSSLNDISYSALIDSSNNGLIMNEDYPENMLLYLQDNSGEFNRNIYTYSDANRRVYNFNDFSGILTTFGITGVSGNILHDFVNEYLIFTELQSTTSITVKMFGRFTVPLINGRDVFDVSSGLASLGLGVSKETRAQSSQNYPPTKKVSTTDISGFNASLWSDSFGNDPSGNSYVNWRSWTIDIEDIHDLQNYTVPTLNGPNPPTMGTDDLTLWARSVL